MNTGSKAVALVDCDSFFASCEQLMNPALTGQPVCVLSNNDGCVIARSKEAKQLGIKMGMPAFQARKLFPKVHYLSGRLDLYNEISHRVISILKDFSPVVEVYSIDEAFIDLAGLRGLYKKSYIEIAKDIRATVKNKVGVPVSIGISLTKTLAKLATERAKESEGYYKIGFRDIKTELMKTELIDIWGIGSNTAELLNKFSINTAYEFIKQDDSFIKRILGKRGLELKLELSGTNLYPVTNEVALPKSIQHTSSFAKFTSDEHYIKDSLNYHAHRSCVRLRRLGLKTQVVGVLLRTKDFRAFFSKLALPPPTNWEFEIFEAVNKVFYELYNPDIIYRSSGVILDNLIEEHEYQLSLFNQTDNRIRQDQLAKTWDKLESKYGSNIILAGNYNRKSVSHDSKEQSSSTILYDDLSSQGEINLL